MTLNTDARNTIAAAYADTFDRLVFLDGATVIGTATVALSAGATGVVTVDPASVTYVADGTIDAAKYASSTGSEEAALTVSTVAEGTGEVQLSQLTAVSGETVDVTLASITVPAS